MTSDFNTDEAEAFGMNPYRGLQKKKRGKKRENHVGPARKQLRHTGMAELTISDAKSAIEMKKIDIIDFICDEEKRRLSKEK